MLSEYGATNIKRGSPPCLGEALRALFLLHGYLGESWKLHADPHADALSVLCASAACIHKASLRRVLYTYIIHVDLTYAADSRRSRLWMRGSWSAGGQSIQYAVYSICETYSVYTMQPIVYRIYYIMYIISHYTYYMYTCVYHMVHTIYNIMYYIVYRI